MLMILDVLTCVDSRMDEDFWRMQKFVEIPHVERPSSYSALKDSAKGSLKGKKIGVPRMYIGKRDPKAKPTVVSQDVIDLWERTQEDLESLGATVIETDFPLVTNYEDDSSSGHANNVQGFTPEWNAKERGELVAYLWDDFLKANADPNYPSLSGVDGSKMFPRPEGYIPDKYAEHKNFMDYPNLVKMARNRPEGKAIWDVEGIASALPALEAQRKRDLEDWMDENKIDVIVFPANGDVGRADVDTNDESARHALQNGVKYSNGNRALRHMGVPTVSVTMGQMAESKMPVNLTFAGKHGQDCELLKYAYDFEQHTRRRVAPPVTPALKSDKIEVRKGVSEHSGDRDSPLDIEVKSAEKVGEREIKVRGKVSGGSEENVSMEAYIDGRQLNASHIKLKDGEWTIEAPFTAFQPPIPLYGGVGKVVNNVVVMILARKNNRVAGQLVLIDQNSSIKG